MRAGLEKYEQIRPASLKYEVRSGILSALSPLMKTLSCTYRDRPRVQFVYAHHVLKDEVCKFRKIIEWLNEKFNIVSYSKAVRRVLEGPIDEPILSLSFDDGLKNCMQVGHILAEYGISACFFVCPGVVGTEDMETLEAFADRLSLPRSPVLSWQEIDELQSLGHEIGGHTFTHRNLAGLSEAEVEKEVHKTFEALNAHTSSQIHFAWPYGRFNEINEFSIRTIFQAGFVSCASATRGCHVNVHEGQRKGLCIRRDHFFAGRPIRDIQVFLALNALLPFRQRNRWPNNWNIE